MDTPPPITPGSPSIPPTPPASSSDRQWKVIIHLCGLAGLIVPSCGNIVAPLVVWLLKKPESPAIDATGRAVMNFQISYTIYLWVSGIVMVVLGWLIIPLILPVAVFVAWLVFTILGAIKASNGEEYTPPFTLKLL
ncbi:hypothetical protein TSACC_3587 [Terrimicrobium sacchariphilum]|uniref:DUF4870 domain-containing protein n=1 Tax=Terrimicrobium sacchariphilum TaxID=690879 RepID=A0A146GD75_TERSA|nr:hypothetical protein TSACC_3587 [Terrimicrobium sacchariphilum]